jgi:ABC-type xylose transport system permease subunit
MANIHLNHLAIIAAALSTFLLGGLWYSPILFGKAWQKENKLSDEELKKGNMALIFGFSFVCSLVMAYNLAFFISSPEIDLAMGALYGFLTGFGWVMLGLAIISLFERRSWKYILINGGYMTLAFTLMGLIIGGWK